jgi:hypothetical protein
MDSGKKTMYSVEFHQNMISGKLKFLDRAMV